MKNRLLIIAIALLGTFQANAQWVSSLSYDIGIPSSDLREFIDKESFRGISAGSQWFMNENTTIGFRIGLQVFKNKVDGIFSTDDGADVQGTQVRYVNSIPLYFTFKKYFGAADGSLRFYAGVGAGGISTREKIDIGIFSVNENDLSFGLGPELGATLPVFANFLADFGIRYNYNLGSKNYSHLNFGIGFSQVLARK